MCPNRNLKKVKVIPLLKEHLNFSKRESVGSITNVQSPKGAYTGNASAPGVPTLMKTKFPDSCMGKHVGVDIKEKLEKHVTNCRTSQFSDSYPTCLSFHVHPLIMNLVGGGLLSISMPVIFLWRGSQCDGSDIFVIFI